MTGCHTAVSVRSRERKIRSGSPLIGVTAGIVDTGVVEGALRRDDLVVAPDEGDLTAIAAAVGRRVDIDHP